MVLARIDTVHDISDNPMPTAHFQLDAQQRFSRIIALRTKIQRTVLVGMNPRVVVAVVIVVIARTGRAGVATPFTARITEIVDIAVNLAATIVAIKR
ncbi:hypothetical protein MUNTM_33570 [Mycobacterium sp. MUNTM1]